MTTARTSTLVAALVSFIALTRSVLASAETPAIPGLSGYRVYALPQCVHSLHGSRENGTDRNEVSGLTGAVMSVLIDTGLNMLIAAIQRAGSDRVGQYNAISGIDNKLLSGAPPSCLYFIKARFSAAQSESCKDKVELFKREPVSVGQPANAAGGKTAVVKPYVCLSEEGYDLAVEAEIHLSGDNSALAVRPTFVHLMRPEHGKSGTRDIVVFAGLMPPASGAIDQASVGAEKNHASVALLQLSGVPVSDTGMVLQNYPLSGWVPLSSEVSLVGGATNAVFLTTETKKGNAFMKQLGEVFNAQKADVSTALKDELIESRRNTVVATQAGIEAAYYEEIAGYETQLSVVRAACKTLLAESPATAGARDAVTNGVATLNSKAAKVKAKAVVIGKDFPQSIQAREADSMCKDEPLSESL